jgi:hypothetical protein
MRRRLSIPVLIALLTLAGAGASRAEFEQDGNIRVRFDAGFSPRSLPRERPAPISHPPALRWLEVELNRNGRLSTAGLPTCAGPLLQATSTELALERCGPALVGKGSFRAVVALGGDVQTGGKVLAFNSREGEHPALLLHFFVRAPVHFTLVAPLTIGHRSDGNFGTVLRAQIPRLGGGLGSITEVDLTIGRRYSAAGRRRSYLSAACGAPADFPGVVFPFARAGFRFETHRKITATLFRDCKVRGA